MPSQASHVQALRTPDSQFVHLPNFPNAAHSVDVPAGDGSGGELRVHFLDEGDPASPTILLLHGEPPWSYLYRHMIPLSCAVGLRDITLVCQDWGGLIGLRLVAAEPDRFARVVADFVRAS